MGEMRVMLGCLCCDVKMWECDGMNEKEKLM